MTPRLPTTKKRALYPMVKRAIDVVLSVAALVVLSPLLAAVAVLVRAKLGSPVVFSQARPGRHAARSEEHTSELQSQ